MRFNKERLKADADCRTVASFIGMRLRGQFCECVSGRHSETQIDHCAIYKDRIHCFSCGNDEDVLGMVRSYYANVLGTPITLSEAMRITGDALGGHELYLESGSAIQETVRIPFTKEQLSRIGLRDFSGNGGINLHKLYREDKGLFMQMVRENAEITLQELEKIRAMLGSTEGQLNLRAAIDLRRAEIKQMLLDAGGTKKVSQLFKI